MQATLTDFAVDTNDSKDVTGTALRVAEETIGANGAGGGHDVGMVLLKGGRLGKGTSNESGNGEELHVCEVWFLLVNES